MSRSRTALRLERLLAIVPHVVRHPGAELSELTRLFGVTEAELLEDLNLVFVTGLPPYGPGDLMDVEIDEGRVWIRMADYFGRPVRLTRDEALALYLRGAALLGSGVGEAQALRSALAKLEQNLGPETLGELRVEVGEAGLRTGVLEAVRTAAGDRRRIEIEYYSATRDRVTSRRIDPEHVFPAIGKWYVVAWCHQARGERMFRADRIREVRPTGETFEPRGLLGSGRPLYARGPGDIRVLLRLGPGAAWVAEYYDVERTHKSRVSGGSLEVAIPTKDLAWMAKLVLRLGAQVEVVEPPELKAQVRGAAEEALALYR